MNKNINRNIKFRVWTKSGNGFIINNIGEKACYDFTPYNWLCNSYFVDDLVWQQFTGLKDKNEKSIYEGDIVKTDPNHITILLSRKVGEYDKGEIRWLREGFEVCQSGKGATRISDYVACGCCPCGLEIIGNVFENPDLLSNMNDIKPNTEGSLV